jgi:hypothetical protein
VGDNLIKIRQSAEEAFLAAVTHPSFGPKQCLHYIFNDVPLPGVVANKGAKKPVPNSKQLGAKY